MATSRIILLPLLLPLVFLLGSCRQQAPGEDPSREAASRATQPETGEANAAWEPGKPNFEPNARDTTPVDASIVGVRLSNQGNAESGQLGTETTRFAPTDTVYAAVETRGRQGGYTLYAKWSGADGSVLSEYGTRVADAGTQRTVVSLSKPDGWEPGEYTVELAINSQPEQQVVFQVQ